MIVLLCAFPLRQDTWLVIKRLLKAGADVTALTWDTGHTPLHLAAPNGQSEVSTILVKAGADLEVTTYIFRLYTAAPGCAGRAFGGDSNTVGGRRIPRSNELRRLYTAPPGGGCRVFACDHNVIEGRRRHGSKIIPRRYIARIYDPQPARAASVGERR